MGHPGGPGVRTSGAEARALGGRLAARLKPCPSRGRDFIAALKALRHPKAETIFRHFQCLYFLRKRKRPHSFLNVAFINAGNDLLSHTLSRAVQSARRGLTSVFGMGTGGSPAV
jgi:hypothetical protein